MTKFSEHFTREELMCPSSREIKLQNGFIDDLEELRWIYSKPMVVTSGCRSKLHNSKLIHDGLPASENSLHMIENKKYGIDCIAIDVAKPNIYDQVKLVLHALDKHWTVRVGKTFIHLDKREKYTDLEQHFSIY